MFVNFFLNKLLFLIAILIAFNNSFAQDFDYEIEIINELFEQIVNTRNDKHKLELNEQIVENIELILNDEESFNYDFSELEFIVILSSDDNKLKIYNWNIALFDGTFKYFGFLQHLHGRNEINVFKLNDLSDFYEEEGRHFSGHKEWFGALYYEIITKRWNRVTYYTLIGWDGANFLINRKVIEVLYFCDEGLPHFGNKMFVVGNTRKDRMIFEYANRAAMLLRYNSKNDIIVIDHLSPPDSKYKGMRQYYGPDLSYDALEFKMGSWIFKSDIDPDIAINYERNRRVNVLRRERESKLNR